MKLLRLLQLTTGALFIYTGAVKAWDPIGFANDIDHYHILPWALTALLAFYLPWLEIACGVALMIRRLISGALGILIALMLVFVAASLSTRARGIDVSCGCFGHAARNLTFGWHIAIDVAILAALALLALRGSRAPNQFTTSR